MDWKTLTATALVGTDRQTPQLASTEGALDAVLTQLDWQMPESALLGTAATLGLYQQVGTLPQTDEIPFETSCRLEEAPLCSGVAARQLTQILGDLTELGGVLPEFLSLTAAAGQRLPEVVLPKLLQLGLTHRDYREAIAAIVGTSVLGERGHWLAAQNPDWSYAAVGLTNVSSSIEELWETGDRALRSDRFHQWRCQDPHAARTFLVDHWQAELARDREKLLATLQTHLSDDDEPFLETALDDRSKTVHQVAADLLAQLPQSLLGQRMVERAQAYINLKFTGSQLILTVNLPTKLDPSWQRDGIAIKSPYKGGLRAYWLRELMSRTPLSWWAEQAPIETLLEAASQTDWQAALLKGWATAASWQRQTDWLEALVHHTDHDGDSPLERSRLLADLPKDIQASLLMKRRPTYGACSEQAWKDWLLELDQCPGPWSHELGQAIIDHLQYPIRFNHAYAYRYAVQPYLKSIAMALPPDLAEMIRERLQVGDDSNGQPDWTDALAKIQTLLAFRQAIHQEFELAQK